MKSRWLRLKLKKDWRKILRCAWSVRWLVAAGIFSAGEVALPLVQNALPIPAGLFAALTGVCVGAAFVSRLVAQKQFGGE